MVEKVSSNLSNMELPVFPEELVQFPPFFIVNWVFFPHFLLIFLCFIQFYSNILQYLPWSDLLTCRLLCRNVKCATDSYIKTTLGGVPDSVPIVINDSNKTWNDIMTFIDLGFSASSFFLNNPSGYEFFDNENVAKFLKVYGDQVSSLHVRMISTCPTGHERTFYEGLTNLTSLKIDTLGRNENKEESIWETIPNPFNGLRVIHPIIDLPDSFSTLKSLSVNVSQNNKRKKPISERRMFTFNVASLHKCLQLEEISVALASNTSLFTDLYLADLFHAIRRCVRKRAFKFPDQDNLKFVDFSACSNIGKGIIRRTSPTFMELCQQLASEGVQVKNVRADLFQAFHPLLYDHSIISSVVESLEGLHPAVLRVQLPNLKSLSIDTWTQASLHHGENLPYLTQWPALKKLRLWVQTKKLRGLTRKGEELPATPVTTLYKILFGTCRPSLESLSLLYGSKMLDTWSNENFAHPSIPSIISSCPNITKLVLYNFPEVDNIVFSKLWSGLALLEEVRIVKCKHLGDQGFIGEDEARPTFFQLKRKFIQKSISKKTIKDDGIPILITFILFYYYADLKKLWLLNLDKMPLITDKLFGMVFRHMKLEELGLASRKPLKSVSRKSRFFFIVFVRLTFENGLLIKDSFCLLIDYNFWD